MRPWLAQALHRLADWLDPPEKDRYSHVALGTMVLQDGSEREFLVSADSFTVRSTRRCRVSSPKTRTKRGRCRVGAGCTYEASGQL